jgi:hypothetical protein
MSTLASCSVENCSPASSSALWSKRTKLDRAVDPTWIFDGWFDLTKPASSR